MILIVAILYIVYSEIKKVENGEYKNFQEESYHLSFAFIGGLIAISLCIVKIWIFFREV